MHPLNHQERQDKFFYFVVLFTISLAVTIVALYTANALLTDAMWRNNSAKISQYSSYRQNQQEYVNQLTNLNEALTPEVSRRGSKGAASLLNTFQTTILRNNDTSVLMSTLLTTYQTYAQAIDAKRLASEALATRIRELGKCQLLLNNPNP